MNSRSLGMGILAGVSLGLAVDAGAIQNWDNGGGDYQWTNAVNWNPDALPTTNDDTRINGACSQGSPVQIAGSATAMTYRLILGSNTTDAGYLEMVDGALTNAATAADMSIGNAGRGWFHLVSGNVYAGRDVIVGNLAGSVGTCLVDGGTLSARQLVRAGYGGTGVVVITGGTVQSGGNADIRMGEQAGSFGQIVVSNGTLASAYSLSLGAAGRGELYVRGGAVTATRYMTLGATASGYGLLSVERGSFALARDAVIGDAGVGELVLNTNMSVRGFIAGNAVGGTGRVEIVGGRLKVGDNESLYVGYAGSGTLTTRGGTFGTAPNNGNLVIRQTNSAFGMCRGWGSCSSTDQLRNNGVVIADGYGAEVDLNLSALDGYTAIPAWANTIENDTTNGWYAVNKGRLRLCSVTIPAGSVTTNWAEGFDDGEIDLVNSMRLTYTGASAGTLNIKLLAADRSDVPAPPAQRAIIGVWDCTNSATFASLDVQCRYDHVAAAGRRVQLYRYNGTGLQWDLLNSTMLSGYRVEATGLTPAGTARIGLLAAIASPVSGTVVLLR